MGIFDGILGPVLDIGKQFVGNMFAEEQQQSQQGFNSAEAAASRAFNASEAEKQRHFTERMSATAYQRSIEDMKRAGLNPMLAYHQGGAQAGAGATASSSPASSGIAAPAYGHSAAQLELNAALAKRTEAEADKVKAEEREIIERTPTHAVSREQMQQQIKESIEKTKLLIQETQTSGFSAAHMAQQAINLRELIPQIRATVDNLRAHTKLAGAQTTLAGATTEKTKSETTEINQRVQANLPALEAALKNLERVSRDLSMPQRQQDASVHDSFLGSLSAVIRSLTGLGSLAK